MKKELFRAFSEEGHAYTYSTRKETRDWVDMPDEEEYKKFLNNEVDGLGGMAGWIEVVSIETIEAEIEELEAIVKEYKGQ